MARNQAGHLHLASFGKSHHQFTGLARGHGDGRTTRVVVVVVVGGALLHGLGMFADLCIRAQHQFMRHLTGVMYHQAQGFACLDLQCVGCKAHGVVHAHFDAAADHLRQ